MQKPGRALALVTAALAACVPVRARPAAAPLDAAAELFRAWESGDGAGLRGVLVEPAAEAELQRFREDLKVRASHFELGDLDQAAGRARVRFRATHTLAGLGEWSVEGELELVEQEGRWRALWSSALLHPDARRGDRFSRLRTRPTRPPLLDGRGAPLTHEGEVVTVGLDPARIQDRPALLAALEAQLGVDPARVARSLELAGASPFVPVIDLRPERYAPLRPALAALPGVFFRKRPARLSAAEGFAATTLGRVGEITAELLAQLGGNYQAGDQVGLSGLELAYERQLGGEPSGEVRLTRPGGESRTLHRFEGREGTAVRTTLLPEVQAAAEAALQGVTQPAALVAVDAEGGGILAVASRPLSEPLNRTLAGRYPPGSTFKVVTAEALLARGLTPQARVACPATVTVAGKTFRNFEGEAFPSTTFKVAFAQSCNTAFISLAAGLPEGALEEAARRFGFGVDYKVGLPAAGATMPWPEDAAERAATAIGQGRVLATPLHMASVAAAAQSGTWRAPFLVPQEDAQPSSRIEGEALEPLRALMRAVVLEGTGKSAASVPGLAGKTGTAEFGRGTPLPTHAWFIGFRERVAFAVLVESGGTGGKIAAPIAARFAAALP